MMFVICMFYSLCLDVGMWRLYGMSLNIDSVYQLTNFNINEDRI